MPIRLNPLPPARRRAVADVVAPSGFRYPSAFLAMLEHDLPDIRPYGWLFAWESIPERFTRILAEMYPRRTVIPFAKENSGDDVFCFDATDVSGNPPVVIIHVFASPGWEYRGVWPSFHDWWLDAMETRAAWLAEHERE